MGLTKKLTTITIDENKSIADVLVKIRTKNQSDLIKNCLKAFLLISLDDNLKNKKTVVYQEIIKEKTLEERVFSLIEVLIYYKDVKNLLVFKVGIDSLRNNCWRLRFFCQPITNQLRFKADIKALTRHSFSVKKTSFGYQAVLVFDL